jgi:hypothetical protein
LWQHTPKNSQSLAIFFPENVDFRQKFQAVLPFAKFFHQKKAFGLEGGWGLFFFSLPILGTDQHWNVPGVCMLL